MTGLEKIIAEIETDSREVAAHQLEEANKKAEAILNEAKNEVELLKVKKQKLANLKQQDILDRAKSSCELETRKAILNKKQELISAVIADAKNELKNLSTKEYFDVLLKLAQNKSSDGKATLQLNSSDFERVPENFSSLLPSEISLSKSACDIQDGFLLIYDGIDINCSFDALFEEKLEELQDKSASILFS